MKVTYRMLDTGYCLAKESQTIRGGSNRQIRCHALVALIRHPAHGWVLFDTGYAPRIAEASERFPYRLYRRAVPYTVTPEGAAAAQLCRFGLSPEDIGTVIISHFHPDHMSGLKDFPQARLAVSRSGWEDVRERRGLAAITRGVLPNLIPAEFAERAHLITEDEMTPDVSGFGLTFDLFGDGSIRLVPLPGHARGQLGLLAETDWGTVFFVADACYDTRSIYENRPPHPMTNLFTESGSLVRDTLHRLHTFAQRRPDIRFIPTHCPQVYADEIGHAAPEVVAP